MKPFFLLIVVLLMPAAFSLENSSSKQAAASVTQTQAEAMNAICPVSGEALTVTKKTSRSQYKGKWVYFCGPECKREFDKNPNNYLSASAAK